MYVHGVILPTEPLTEDMSGLALESVSAKSYLEWQIYQIRSMRKEPVVILGPDGDDLLRAIPKLADRRLAYTRDDLPNMLSQIQAGLKSAGTCAFYLPLNVPCPTPLVWSAIERAMTNKDYNDGTHVIAPLFAGRPGFPILITVEGKDWLEENSAKLAEINAPNTPGSKDFLSLPGLKVQTVDVESETALQLINSPHEFEDWKSLYTA
jgi:hypothetical protein